MAQDNSNELFMQLIDKNGQPVPAECQTEVDTDADNFISEYFNGEFFALDDFHFGMNLSDEDASTDAANRHGKGSGAQNAQNAQKTKKSAAAVKFGKWKAATTEDLKKMKFPLKADEFTVTRRYDKASPLIFSKCALSESYPRASIVKRKVVGDAQLQAFLKFDFEDVLITHVQFQESDVLKETLTFIFRKMSVRYKPQAPDGTLGSAGSVSLDYAAALRAQAGGY